MNISECLILVVFTSFFSKKIKHFSRAKLILFQKNPLKIRFAVCQKPNCVQRFGCGSEGEGGSEANKSVGSIVPGRGIKGLDVWQKLYISYEIIKRLHDSNI